MTINDITNLFGAIEHANETVYKGYGGPYYTVRHNMELSVAILETLKAANRPMRVMEILTSDPDRLYITVAKATCLLRQLVAAGYVKREEIDGEPIVSDARTIIPKIAYFSIV